MSYSIIKNHGNNIILLINQSDSILLNKIKSKRLYIGNIHKENMDELSSTYYKRKMESNCK